MRRSILFLGALLMAGASSVANANGLLWLAAQDSELDSMRGGFSLGSGLMVSFGITRTVLLDGLVSSRTSMNFGDLRSITTVQARELAAQATHAGLVQSGPGNVAVLHGGSIAGPLVVQNSLNDRHIQTLTELNVVTNGAGLFRGTNLTRTLTDAIGASVR